MATYEKQAIDSIARMVLANGWTLDDAAAVFRARQPRITAEVLDRIGCWPSSTPELAALQRRASRGGRP